MEDGKLKNEHSFFIGPSAEYLPIDKYCCSCPQRRGDDHYDCYQDELLIRDVYYQENDIDKKAIEDDDIKTLYLFIYNYCPMYVAKQAEGFKVVEK